VWGRAGGVFDLILRAVPLLKISRLDVGQLQARLPQGQVGPEKVCPLLPTEVQ